ncbi:hypothetical protein BBD42_07160 [Paenibacillus sp. BIHB 4019]|uniref:Uncharacterized protein n=1 Tax=Paenibacillus sp. BIHB 4019 TaxID=1870819 RepID=A0A1B2DEY5_9BACL|nr:hypothetical protein [Paenibacillus sp. BIHB 4019]ANY66270.1 hypothetical protein BBD42_07160 [Paenibacillus sp. BIHB 4019]
MDDGMSLRDSSTWNAEKDTFDVVPVKNAHDKADVTDPNPPPFTDYDASKDFNKHFDKDIEC